MARDYKDEYEKFQKDKVAYRARLNKYNRDKGTYGNDDGLDATHKNGKISGFVPSSKNKGKKEKSRMKGSKRKKYKSGGKLEGLLEGPSHEEGGIKFEVGGEIQEAEGGEYVISKDAAKKLVYENLEHMNETGVMPTVDARKRRG